MEVNLTENDERVIVLDTSAFIAGFDPFSIKLEQYTVPLVKEELQRNTMIQVRFKTAKNHGRLKVISPKKEFLDKITVVAKHLGDSFFLSKTDIQLLALAFQLKQEGKLPLIATDDYSIQNVADRIDVRHVSLTTLGIRSRLKWVRYCPACYKQYPADFKSDRCRVCDTELKRKPVNKESSMR
jgi:UPF0271 protein